MNKTLLAISIMPLSIRSMGDTLELSYDDKTKIPTAHADLYTEVGGKWTLTGVNGIKTQADIDRLQGALDKERNDHKSVKERYAPISSYKIEDVVSRLSEYDELKIRASTGGVDDKKLDELVEARIKSRLSPLERQLEEYKNSLASKDAKIGEFESKDVQRRIKKAVAVAAKGAKVVDSAVDDAIIQGQQLFHLTEDGRVVAKDNVGITPGIDPTVWLSDMLKSKPHWFGSNVGGGSGGGNGGGNGGGQNPWSHEGWNMTEQSRIYRENPERATTMAAQYGVDPLAPVKPAKK
ncbi:MAG: hypothetical protein RR619_06340 [Raoultibacter sp.]